MPNQWVKAVTGDYNIQTCWPVKHGRPDMNGHYTLIAPHLHEKLNRDKTYRRPYVCISAEDVELLGPDECARLDAEYGLTGEEGQP